MKPTEPGKQRTPLVTDQVTPQSEKKKGKVAIGSVTTNEARDRVKQTGRKRSYPEEEFVGDRKIKKTPNFVADFSASAALLHKAFSSEEGFRQQPFKLQFIGGSDTAAVVCPGPDADHVSQFWHEFQQSECKLIVNINSDDDGGDYYPESNQILSQDGLVISRTDVVDSAFLTAMKDEGSTETDNQCEQMVLDISGVMSLKTELYRIKDWEDGKGYDPQRAIALARLLPMGETLVHCRAGLGRTGTLVVIMQLVKQDDCKLLTPGKAVDTLVGIIQGDRYDRDDNNFVTSEAQFNCLLQVVQILTGLSEQEIEAQVQEVINTRLKS